MNVSSLSEDRFNLRGRLKAATRTAILDAAAASFAGRDAAHVRMEDIAARAGIAVGTLYNYFEDRAALVAELLDQRKGDLLAGLDDALATAAPFDERLGAFVDALLAHFEANRALLTLLFDGVRGQADASRGPRTVSYRRTAAGEVLVRAERLLTEGVESGAIRDVDPSMHAALLVGMVRGAVLNAMRSDGMPLNRCLHPITSLFLHGCARGRRGQP
jgi:AcrR family transcriptional regulator